MAESVENFSSNDESSNDLSVSAFEEIQVSGNSPCKSANDFERHGSIHDNDVFSCDQCTESFTQVHDLNLHKRSHTKSDEVAQSSENTHVSDTFSQTFHLKEVPTQYHSKFDGNTCDKPHVCRECDKSFKSAVGLKRHLSIHDLQKCIHSCDECSKSFTSKHHVKLHKRVHSEKIHSCDKPHVCSECDKSFKSAVELQRHLEKIHSCDKPHVCSKCDKSFKSAVGLQRHLSIHDLQKHVHVCDECSQSFSNAHHLKLHKRVHSEKIHRCESCAKVLANMCKLEGCLTDEEKRDLLCDLCSSGFELVTNRRFYVCSVCQKSFLQKIHLDRHFLLHTGERPFACHVCDKSFVQKCTLDEHLLIHSSKNAFECQVCWRRFASKVYLKKHLKMHTHVDENYACDKCSKKFTQKRYLAKHKRAVHKKAENQLCL